MLVTCNNKYQYWCPHGTKNCVCDMYEERDYVADESFEFTCTDINDDQRDCHLVLIPETNIELYTKKIMDMLYSGVEIQDVFKKINTGYDLKDIAKVLSQKEFSFLSESLSKKILLCKRE